MVDIHLTEARGPAPLFEHPALLAVLVFLGVAAGFAVMWLTDFQPPPSHLLVP